MTRSTAPATDGGTAPRTAKGTSEVLSKLRTVLPAKQRSEAIGLFVLMAIVALVETVGVGTIVPFVTVAADPAELSREGPLGTIYRWSGAGSENRFILLLGLTVLFVLLVGNALRAWSTWRAHRFSQMTGHALAMMLLRTYLARPYGYFLKRHSADLGKNVLHEVHQVVNGVVFPVISGLSRAITALLLFTLLFAVEPVLTLTVLVSLGGVYGLIYAMTRTSQARLGERYVVANRKRYYVASEMFSGVKEIKVRGLETTSMERYSAPSLTYARNLALSMTLSQTPRFFLEVVAFGGVIVILLILIKLRGGFADVLPIVSLYVFAAYRLLPALQELFSTATRLRFSWPSVDLIHREIIGAPAEAPAEGVPDPLPYGRAIRVENVVFRYAPDEDPVINEVSLTIPCGARVGFIGPTGSGKSTIIDLLLGLLRPQAGRILVDETSLEDEEVIRRWQKTIGYVPQHIFLADDSVAANIAFGKSSREIDRKSVEKAARVAQLHDFIVNQLPEGYDTPVGERGIRLSGGQRQRLGLARALYGDPAVLVLDEATSALDSDTEAKVMRALEAIGRDVTIITVAHRLATVRHSDIVFRMQEGRVVASGTADEVTGMEEKASR